jgi:hypothetical protein
LHEQVSTILLDSNSAYTFFREDRKVAKVVVAVNVPRGATALLIFHCLTSLDDLELLLFDVVGDEPQTRIFTVYEPPYYEDAVSKQTLEH